MKKVFESGFAREVPEEEEIKTAGNEPETVEEKMDLENLTPDQLDQIIIDNVYLKPGQATVYPKGYLDRLKELRASDFSKANNWPELYAIIASKGSVTTSEGEKQTAQETLDIIDEVRSGKKMLVGVTRTGGLRDRVRELWLEEHDKAIGVSAEDK